MSEFVLPSRYTVLDLGTLGGANSNGYARSEDETVYAFIAPEDTMIDLNTLLPPGCGWILTKANDINDNGWITGEGYINGQTRAYLLVPED